MHVCLITGVLAGSRRAGPASRITLLEKLTISAPQHLLDFFFSHKGNEMCLQRKCWCIRVLICSDSKQQKVLITSKFAESFITSFVLMSKHNTTHVNCCDPSNPPKGTLFVQRETLYNLHSLMTWKYRLKGHVCP